MLNEWEADVDPTDDSSTERLFAPSDRDALHHLINDKLRKLGGLKDAVEKAKKKRALNGPQKTALLDLQQRVGNLEMLQSPNEPFKRFNDFSQRKIVQADIEKIYGNGLTPKQMTLLIDAEVERKICYQVIRFYEKELSTVQDTYTELLNNHSKGVTERLKGRQKNIKENEKILMGCLQKAKTLIQGKRWKKTDYPIFRDLAKQDEFKPAFIPLPRVAGPNKDMSEEERTKFRESNKRTTWTESYLRNFFHQRTGLDPTTKKEKS
ncbi:hypothetical protein [Polynucleobacter sp. Adler-ghost]|uniref:hypothetical protein n=1 Tax=Polynucleobacter sp. Adler-ghost TaxID=2770234 RepID=UPI001BFE6764|nr:hypothetical protein [Polynucleobacter sp. Adler-ghost]QWE31445.1 hypothetical protein ICV89_03790 [Polynucleobacter sp. Adler-ghost]